MLCKVSMPRSAALLSLSGTENFEIKEDVCAKLQSLCSESMAFDRRKIMADDAIVDPSTATRILLSLFLPGMRHLFHGFSFNAAISFSSVLTSVTSFASLVLRSRSFSAREVISHERLHIILRDDLSGPKNGPEISND